MHVKIDWISFSLVWHSRDNRGGESVVSNLQAELLQLDPSLIELLDIGAHWTDGLGRKPYAHSWQHPDSKITLFFNPTLTHCLFEISGTGCDWLYQRGRLLHVLSSVQTRVTRIDVACDMECTTSPTDFCNERDTTRFKSSSFIKEQSGETQYIGSRHSNRYARVYRYNEPHERAHLLRSEFVLKAEDAKLGAKEILETGLEGVAMALGERFGWRHASWDKSLSEPAELTAYRADRGEGKTVFWLADTVAPLLLRLHREGVIDVNAWFHENIENKFTAEDMAKMGQIPF